MKTKKKNKGILLLLTLAILAILATLAIFIWSQSNAGQNLHRYQQAIGLAESGSEAFRAWIQAQYSEGNGLPVTADTTNLGAPATYPLSFAGGGKVAFAATSIAGTQARGIPVSGPIYDASGNQIGTAQIGYFAAYLKQGPPTEIFALGALGSNPDGIYYVREIHLLVMAESYSQFAYFSDDPQDQLQLIDKSRDPISGNLLSTNCPACPSDLTMMKITANNYIPMAPTQVPSFDRLYTAGQIVVDLTNNNELTGMSSAEFIINQPVNQATLVKNNTIYIPPGGNAGLYAGPSAANIGLPNQAALNRIMQTLFNQAIGGGLFIYDQMDTALNGINWNPAVGSSWVPLKGWDPSAASPTVNLDFNSAGWNGASCQSGTGDLRVTNPKNHALVYFLNGAPKTIPALSSLCLNSATLGTRAIYVDGNMQIQADPKYGYSGQFSVVSPGQVAISGDLASKSFIDESNLTSVPPSFQSNASDVSAILTPYQILFSPPPAQQEGFTSTMVLMQLGIPWSSAVNPGNLPANWLGNNPPASLQNQLNFTIQMSNPCNGCMYNNIYLSGTQISYHRTGNWYYYYTNVYRPFDRNLLSTGPPLNVNYSAGCEVVGWHEVNRFTGKDMTWEAGP